MDPAQALEAAALAQQKPMLEAMAAGESEVQRFYKNCTVFVTGATGFLGKQLLEKLLRCCEIKKAFMLVRPKKGKTVRERMLEVITDSCFDTLRQQQPKFTEKIKPIKGDISDIKLGICEKDWDTLIQEVEVIFHVAATTRFDEPLRTSTFINVRGTREAILLGKACKKLRSYVHVSTAYSHATNAAIGGQVDEKFYTTPIQPDALISMAESMDTDRLDGITKNLIKDWPNTYTFTKAVAEDLVRTKSDGLPICIVRPAIVLSTYREPVPGWLDKSCVFGVTGLVTGVAVGLLTVSIMDRDKNAGYIPCDYVNNAMLVAARETASNQAKGGDHTKIYTVCSTHRNPISYGDMNVVLESKGRQIATPKAVYYSVSLVTKKMYIFTIFSFFLQKLPAYVADFVCLLMGKEKMFVKLVKKLPNIFTALSYFTLNDWDLVDNNVASLFSRLSPQDQAIFNFDVTDIDWTECMLVECIGVRKYILKDGLKDTAYAIKKQKYLKVAHYVFVSLYAYAIWKSLCLMYWLVCSFVSLFIGFVCSFNVLNE